AALALFVPWLTRLQYACLIGAAVAFLVWVVLNGGRLRALSGRRSARYGAGAAVVVLLALGVVVIANALSGRHNARSDLTQNRRNPLPPQPVQLLRGLKTPVQAIAFLRTDVQSRRTPEDLLNQYASHSGGKFTWRLEDSDKAPGLAREYGVESYGTVVLKG